MIYNLCCPGADQFLSLVSALDQVAASLRFSYPFKPCNSQLTERTYAYLIRDLHACMLSGPLEMLMLRKHVKNLDI